MYASNAKGFYDALEVVLFETPKEYEQSWTYKCQELTVISVVIIIFQYWMN